VRFYRTAPDWETRDAVGRPGTVWAGTPGDADKLADTLHFGLRPPRFLNPRRRPAWRRYEIDVDRDDVFDLTEPKGQGAGLLEWARSHTPPGTSWARFAEPVVQSPCLIRVAEEPAPAIPFQ
jgi:hypothetical protein